MTWRQLYEIIDFRQLEPQPPSHSQVGTSKLQRFHASSHTTFYMEITLFGLLVPLRFFV